MTTVVEQASDLAACMGKKLGTSEWVTLDQRKIDAFAEITGDDHWIHIDTGRAGNELPDGKTLVHGFLTLAMIPFLQRSVFRVDLALAMGHEDIRVDAVTEATQAIINAAREAGKLAAMFVPNLAEREQFAAVGPTCFVVGSDQSMVRQGALALAAMKPA